MIEAAVTDVVTPSVAANNPDALACEGIGQRKQPHRVVVLQPLQFALELSHASPLGIDARSVMLISGQYFVCDTF
jgi:hypothetical protein